MSESYVYLLLTETSITGAWSEPINLVKACFSEEELVDYHGNVKTIEEFTEYLLDGMKDDPDPYSYVVKVKVDPTKDDEVWYRG